jgi:hypothetical protein
MTSLLELALWKIKLDSSVDHGIMAMGVGNKKMKMDVTDFRLQCRINCGADHVVENVLPYLLQSDFVLSIDDSSDDDEEDDDNSDDGNDNGANDEEKDNYGNGEYAEVIDEEEEAL